MDMTASTIIVGFPALSPFEHELLRVLSQEKHERNVARELSVDVSGLRTHVKRLARKLNLPEEKSIEREFSQLACEADRYAKLTAGPTGSTSKTNRHDGSSAWERKLAEIARAIAKGVLITIDPYLVRPMRGQPRDYFPEEEQESLEGSLSYVGQIQDTIIRRKSPPISRSDTARTSPHEGGRIWRIADTQYEICDGERRWRGVMRGDMPELRAKLIEIDDEGAYLVAAVSNFNRVGHTTLEKARNIERLSKGETPLPMEVICAMQGISRATADKLLLTLKLPSDIHQLMDPERQKQIGQDVLGKVPSYEIARLASNPNLHEHARDLARRYVKREIKLPEVRDSVDRILSQAGATRNVVAERHQPARRLRVIEGRLDSAVQHVRDVKLRLQDMKDEGVLPEQAIGLQGELNSIMDTAEACLKLVGGKRTKIGPSLA